MGVDGRKPAFGFVLGDYTLRGGPGRWAKVVVRVYKKYQANVVKAEGNQGSELVRQVIHQVCDGVPMVVVYASRSKQARAEPVVMLYEQDRVHHVGVAAELEDEMVTWVPGEGASPNRVDWLVWGLTELIVKREERLALRCFDESKSPTVDDGRPTIVAMRLMILGIENKRQVQCRNVLINGLIVEGNPILLFDIGVCSSYTRLAHPVNLYYLKQQFWVKYRLRSKEILVDY